MSVFEGTPAVYAQQEYSTNAIKTGEAVCKYLRAATGLWQYWGCRFNSVTIPQGATITAAEFQVYFGGSEANRKTGSVNWDISKQPNYSAFSKTAGELSEKLLALQAEVKEPEPMPSGFHAFTCTGAFLKSLEEFFAQGEWVSGNALVMVLSGAPTSKLEITNAAQPPKLKIEYTAAASTEAMAMII